MLPNALIDLELALAKMKSGKAPGPVNINPKLVKKGWTHQGPQLVDLFNASDTQGREVGSSISSNQGKGRRLTQDPIDLFAYPL